MRLVTKHPGSKKPTASNYRGNAINPHTPFQMRPRPKHGRYHEKPGKTQVISPRPRKGAVWRAVTRPIRRLPGWQKRATSSEGKHMYRIGPSEDDA